MERARGTAGAGMEGMGRGAVECPVINSIDECIHVNLHNKAEGVVQTVGMSTNPTHRCRNSQAPLVPPSDNVSIGVHIPAADCGPPYVLAPSRAETPGSVTH